MIRILCLTFTALWDLWLKRATVIHKGQRAPNVTKAISQAATLGREFESICTVQGLISAVSCSPRISHSSSAEGYTPHTVPSTERQLFLGGQSPPLEDRFPLLSKRLQGLIPILRLDDPVIHRILHLLVRPLHSLQRRPRRDRPALADLRGQPNSLAQHVPPRRREDLVRGRLVPVLQLLHVLLALRHDLDQPVRDAQEVGLRRGHPPAGEDQISCAPDSDQRGEAVRPSRAGDNS